MNIVQDSSQEYNNNTLLPFERALICQVAVPLLKLQHQLADWDTEFTTKLINSNLSRIYLD